MIHDIVIPCELWNRSFGNLHFKAPPRLQKMVKGMPIFKFDLDNICRGCALGKNIKKSFPSSTNRYKGVLDLIHLYVCGPMLAPSLSGYLNFVSFIDDFSQKS